jgi:uncharacterized protein
MASTSRRRIAAAFAIAAAAFFCAPPAGAQVSAGRSDLALSPRVEPVQFRQFFRFPFFDDRGPPSYYSPYNRPYNPFSRPRPQPQVYESNKAPPPRKLERPPSSSILVIGDAFADWLGYGLEAAFADTPEIGIVRKVRPYSGLVRYEARADAPEWAQAVKDVLAAEKPSAIVVMLGINDRLPIRERTVHPPAGQAQTAPSAAHPEAAHPEGGQSSTATNETRHNTVNAVYEFHTDHWAEAYGKRIDEMIAALKSKGVPVLWVGLPAVRGARSTSDVQYLDELYRAHAEKDGIPYIDVWDGFVDDRGQFVPQGPDFEGQIRRLRSYDGVYFTKAGAEKLAHYVERELRRVVGNRLAPVAVPPEQQPSAKAGAGAGVGARPAVGPVVPLTTNGSDGHDLLGAEAHPAQHDADPVAARVLSRGEPIPSAPGRADDFAWPHGGASQLDSDKTQAGNVGAKQHEANRGEGGASEANKGEANKTATQKPEGDKAELKKPAEVAPAPATPAAPAKPRRIAPALNGAPPRAPLVIAPAGGGVH